MSIVIMSGGLGPVVRAAGPHVSRCDGIVRNVLATGAAIRKSLIVPVQVYLLICSSLMPAQHQLADVLRITLRRVEQDFIEGFETNVLNGVLLHFRNLSHSPPTSESVGTSRDSRDESEFIDSSQSREIVPNCRESGRKSGTVIVQCLRACPERPECPESPRHTIGHQLSSPSRMEERTQ
jgi:hypothetical protein